MQNTLKIRYKYINRIVNDLYLSIGIKEYPIDISKVLNSFSNISVVSYSQFMHDFNLTIEQIFSYLTSNDGCCDYKPSLDKYIIYYNDITIHNKNRIMWTIIHELAHIHCNHYHLSDDILNDYSDDEIYDFKEREENYFTSVFLAHHAILSQLNIHNSYEIEVFCNLSSEAAQYRYKNFLSWTNHNFLISSDRCVLRNFGDYIHKKNQEYQDYLEFRQAFYR